MRYLLHLYFVCDCCANQDIAPKHQSLLDAEVIYKDSMMKLQIKQAELFEITSKLQRLKDELSFKQELKKVSCLT